MWAQRNEQDPNLAKDATVHGTGRLTSFDAENVTFGLEKMGPLHEERVVLNAPARVVAGSQDTKQSLPTAPTPSVPSPVATAFVMPGPSSSRPSPPGTSHSRQLSAFSASTSAGKSNSKSGKRPAQDDDTSSSGADVKRIKQESGDANKKPADAAPVLPAAQAGQIVVDGAMLGDLLADLKEYQQLKQKMQQDRRG